LVSSGCSDPSRARRSRCAQSCASWARRTASSVVYSCPRGQNHTCGQVGYRGERSLLQSGQDTRSAPRSVVKPVTPSSSASLRTVCLASEYSSESVKHGHVSYWSPSGRDWVETGVCSRGTALECGMLAFSHGEQRHTHDRCATLCAVSKSCLASLRFRESLSSVLYGTMSHGSKTVSPRERFQRSTGTGASWAPTPLSRRPRSGATARVLLPSTSS
jgi:hypothetical protein